MDKNKAFETASKYASKGQLDKAAKEYQRVLDEDPKDVRALQKLAEVLQKLGKPKDATDLMLRVAEGFTEQGFFLKAVAVYKQALKVGPERVEVNQKLAGLYQQLGLIGDATQQYQLVATYYDTQGNVKESLAALRKMVELDPDSVASQVKLGELYAREKMNTEAVAELRKAAVYLKRNNRTEDYLRVLDRIVQIAPEDTKLARELAEAFLANGDTKRALSRLQVCFRANPKDVDTLELLASAFSALGQEARTVSVYRELAAVHAASGRADAEKNTLQRILEIAPGDEECVLRLRELGVEMEPDAPMSIAPMSIAPPPPKAKPPPPPPPTFAPMMKPAGLPTPELSSSGTILDMPRLVTKAAAPPPTVSKSIQKVLTEADVYIQYGLLPKALDRIRKALGDEPNCLPLHEKLLAILDRQTDGDAALDQLVTMIGIAREAGDGEHESAYVQDLAQRAPDHELVTQAAAEADLPELDGDVVLDEGEGEFADDGEPIEAADGEALEEGVEGEQVFEADEGAEGEFLADENGEPGEQNTGEWSTNDDSVLPITGGELDLDEGGGELELDEAPDSEAAVRDAPEMSDALALSMAADELPKAELSQPWPEPPAPPSLPGSNVTAPHTITEPSLAPSDKLVLTDDEPREPTGPISLPALPSDEPPLELAEQPAEAAPEVMEEEAPAGEAAEYPEAAEAAPEEQPFAAELEEAEFLIQQESPDDAREVLNAILAQAPDHEAALALLKSITPEVAEAEAEATPAPAVFAPPVPDEGGGGIDLGRELADEFDSFGSSDGPREAAPLRHTPTGPIADLGGVKLDTKVGQEDSQTHFDLGIAYKEMGLNDEAIREFEIAQKGTGSRHVLDCLMMIGLCHIARGDAAKALEQFKAALKTPGLTLAASKELHYEIAHCHELMGEKQQAIDHLSRIFKADPAYRDTKARLQTLMRETRGAASIVPGRPRSPATIAGKPRSPASRAPKSLAPKSVAPKNGVAHPPASEPSPQNDSAAGPPSRKGGGRKIGYI